MSYIEDEVLAAVDPLADAGVPVTVLTTGATRPAALRATHTVVLDFAAAMTADLPTGARGSGQVVFLGTGWTVGLAAEAALKPREAARFWTESYPAMEYRHARCPSPTTGR